jgi:hypothetical protein
MASATCGSVCATKPPWVFGAAHQVFDAGPNRDGGAAKPRRRWEGSTAGRHVPRRVMGALKASFGEGKRGTLARIPGSATSSELGLVCGNTGTLGGTSRGGHAGKAAHEGKCRRARTPNRPSASSTGRKAFPNSEASARGRNAGELSWDGMEQKKEAALWPCEHGRACLGARMRERDERCVRAHADVKTIDGG